ncbi:zinc-ribbon domain-containing protein [Bifidobacterium samirii]|nr:zinc-ribbon domain-containing protein [Bifidobacterium samirii]
MPCGAGNPDEAKFCRQCGAPFAVTQPAATEAEPDTSAMQPDEPVATASVEPVTTPSDESSVTATPIAQPIESPVPAAQPDQPTQPVAQPIVPQYGQPYVTPADRQYAQPHPQQPVTDQPMATQPIPVQPAVQPQPMPFVQNQSVPQYAQQPMPQYPQQYLQQGMPQYAQPGMTQPGMPPQGASQPQAGTKPIITPEMKAEARAFGDWFKTFFLRPSEVGGGKPWYALVVIFGTMFLSALAATVEIAHGGSAMLDIVPFMDGYYMRSAVREAAPFVCIVLWIVFSLYQYGMLLILRLMRMVMGDPVTFRTLHDDYAHRLAPWFGLFALSAVAALINLDVLAIVLWALAVLTQSMWMMVLVYEGEAHRKLDSQWVKFLCVLLQIVLSAVVFAILVSVLSTIIGAIIAGAMHNVLY